MTDESPEPIPPEDPVTFEDSVPAPAPAVGRRNLVSSLAFGGLAVGAGAAGAWVVRANDAATYRKRALTVEVACLGNLWRTASVVDNAGDADFRTPFCVEGWIYPEGTIKGDGFAITEDGSIGRWFCHGWVVIDADRPQPHITSQQDFIFGAIQPTRLFPPDSINTAGLEGSDEREQIAHRAVIGGTGEYLGATGQVTQQFFATNTTPFFPETVGESPCFRFIFDLRVLE
jgi:hypothetical protein